jgi:hypothetical protein
MESYAWYPLKVMQLSETKSKASMKEAVLFLKKEQLPSCMQKP